MRLALAAPLVFWCTTKPKQLDSLKRLPSKGMDNEECPRLNAIDSHIDISWKYGNEQGDQSQAAQHSQTESVKPMPKISKKPLM